MGGGQISLSQVTGAASLLPFVYSEALPEAPKFPSFSSFVDRVVKLSPEMIQRVTGLVPLGGGARVFLRAPHCNRGEFG